MNRKHFKSYPPTQKKTKHMTDIKKGFSSSKPTAVTVVSYAPAYNIIGTVLWFAY